MRILFKLASVVLGIQCLVAGAAFAHEGHDHGAPPPPVSTTVAPRMEASSGDFELVAVAGPAEVSIYLDTFRTNEPVPDAEIDVDSGGETLKAEPMGEGVYAVKPKWVGTPAPMTSL